MKRYKLIACKVLQREIASCLVRTKNFIDLTFIRQEYHEMPKNLVDILQAEIDMVESGKDVHSGEYNNPLRMKKLDAILLGYGLCSNALVGLRAKSLPLVIPRAHDCTTLLMGSKEAYREYFDTVKGTSFITRGWVDNGKNFEEKDLDRIRAMYMEKYQDEDTVDMLMEFEQESMAGYSVLTGIFWPELPDPDLEEHGKAMAEEHGWESRHYEGSSSLLFELLNGDWDPEKFLVVPPGQTIKPSYDADIIKAAP